MPAAASLRIIQFAGDGGFYLLYLDETGEELTDTYHDSIDGAVAQAEWEYGVKAEEWQAGLTGK